MKRQSQSRPEAIPELRIQLTKRADESVVLRCIRRDGSSTWQRYEHHSRFYSFHDLRHFAVETTLNCRSGFYGLIADGWDISDTGGKGARGKPPSEALVVEHIVGLLEGEAAGAVAPLTASEFNSQMSAMLASDLKLPHFTDAQLASVRNRIQELHRQWTGIPAGSALELTFNRI